MTETNMDTSNPYDGERRAGTVGFPLPGVELRIADAETGSAVGRAGSASSRCAAATSLPATGTCRKRPGRSSARTVLHHRRPRPGRRDGYVTIVGRAKDLVISGGYNIYPKEVEMLLDAEPGVRNRAVIGVPHPRSRRGVVASSRPSRGPRSTRRRCSPRIGGRLARFKQPRRIFVVDELPRNTMGKVQKNVLRERYKDVFKR